jgi:hypothetical protein
MMILAASVGPGCDYDLAANHHLHKLDPSGLVGRSFDMPYLGGCCWGDTFDTTAWLKMLQCESDNDTFGLLGCAACTPTTDVTAASSMTVSWCVGSLLSFDFHITGSDPELDGDPAGYPVVGSSLAPEGSPTCCQSWHAIADGPTGSEPINDWLHVFVTSALVLPC